MALTIGGKGWLSKLSGVFVLRRWAKIRVGEGVLGGYNEFVSAAHLGGL